MWIWLAIPRIDSKWRFSSVNWTRSVSTFFLRRLRRAIRTLDYSQLSFTCAETMFISLFRGMSNDIHLFFRLYFVCWADAVTNRFTTMENIVRFPFHSSGCWSCGTHSLCLRWKMMIMRSLPSAFLQPMHRLFRTHHCGGKKELYGKYVTNTSSSPKTVNGLQLSDWRLIIAIPIQTRKCLF